MALQTVKVREKEKENKNVDWDCWRVLMVEILKYHRVPFLGLSSQATRQDLIMWNPLRLPKPEKVAEGCHLRLSLRPEQSMIAAVEFEDPMALRQLEVEETVYHQPTSSKVVKGIQNDGTSSTVSHTSLYSEILKQTPGCPGLIMIPYPLNPQR